MPWRAILAFTIPGPAIQYGFLILTAAHRTIEGYIGSLNDGSSVQIC